MSGALVSLLSKGAQDLFVKHSLDTSAYKSKYTSFVNFAQNPSKMVISGTVANNAQTIVKLERRADLMTYMWLEGTNIVDNLPGTLFELYIGGQLIDAQTYDYIADIWQIYMAENKSKSDTINNKVSKTNSKFFPLHFFFCDNENFLPLVALQYYEAEIRIKWGSTIENVSDLNVYGNYVYLDGKERKMLATNQLDMLITQVQRIPYVTGSVFNIKYFNHPVKALFFGAEAASSTLASDYWTFASADLTLNGSTLFDKMTPTYFYTVQVYNHTDNGITDYNEALGSPVYTRYFMYSFGNKVNKLTPSGTCNFSRIESAKLTLNGFSNPNNKTFNIYAVNYNILRIRDGMGGILFSN